MSTEKTENAVGVEPLVMAQRAFIVRHPDVDGAGVYRAETASKVRYAAYLQAQDAGFYDLQLIDFRVARAKQYDNYKIDRNGKALEFIEYYAS